MRFWKKSKIEKNTAMFVAIYIFALILRLRNINRPFTEYFRYINTQYATYARNYIWYGYINTKFGLVSTPCYVSDGQFNYYFHHPPLISIYVSLFFKMFGINEASVRLAEISLSMVTLLLIYKISKKLWNAETAILSMFIFSFMPLPLYYDRMIAPDYSTIPFVLLTLYSYILWRESENTKYLYLMGVSLFIGTWFDWQAYLIVPGIVIHSLFEDKISKKTLKIIAFLGVTSILAFGSYLIFVYMLGGWDEVVELYQGFLTRSGIKVFKKFDKPGANYSFTLFQFLVLEFTRSVNLFTSVILIFAGVWVIYFSIKRPKKDYYVLLLFIQGIFSILIFKQGAWIHDFWLYQLVPAIVLSASRGILVFSDVMDYWKSIYKQIPFSLTLFLVVLSSSFWTGFLLMILKKAYNFNPDSIILIITATINVIIFIAIWFSLSSSSLHNYLFNVNSLKYYAIIFSSSILLLSYIKNMFYPFVPGYHVLVTLGWMLVLVSSWILLKSPSNIPFGNKRLKSTIVIVVLLLFVYQSIYVTKVRDSWEYPYEYKYGLILKNVTNPEDRILTIPGTGLHAYSSTFYSERCVELVFSLKDFLARKNSSHQYKYFVTTKILFEDSRYSDLKDYLISHYPCHSINGLYIFDISANITAP